MNPLQFFQCLAVMLLIAIAAMATAVIGHESVRYYNAAR